MVIFSCPISSLGGSISPPYAFVPEAPSPYVKRPFADDGRP